MGKPVDIPSRKQPGSKDFPWTWVGIAVLILLIFVFFLLPAWKGYRTYQAAKDAGVEDYVGSLAELAQAKEAAEASAREAQENLAAYTGEVESARTGISEAQSARESAEAELKQKSEQCELLLNSYSEDLQTVKADLRVCEDEREGIVADAANRLCCIQRTFDDEITGYEIEDGSIVCVHEGGESISC